MKRHISSFYSFLLVAVPLSLATTASAQTVNEQFAQPQTPPAAAAPTAVPALVPYSGTASGSDGKPLAVETGVTFLIFSAENGGEPLFAETQTVPFDANGRYKVELGSTLPSGLPSDLFANGEARWLEVEVSGQPPQPRVLLASVPYALKSADAATLGGFPASAFVLAGSREAAAFTSQAVGSASTTTPPDVTTSGGVSGYLAEFSGASSVVDSPVFVNGANVGIGMTAPTATLDVNGATILNGALTVNSGTSFSGAIALEPLATATASAAQNSQMLKFYSSAYDSATGTAITPRFEWQAEPKGNNTAAPTGTLNLLSATTGNPAESGFSFNANGTINFAPGQTFPGGPGLGTITGVTAGTGLTGGGTTGSVTLNIDTTKLPILAAANTFTGNQTVTGNLSASGTASAGTVNAGSAFDLDGSLFAIGTPNSANAYVGFFSNTENGGNSNASLGAYALQYNTGDDNTAAGYGALASNTTGGYNSAIGNEAMYNNTTGSENSAVGEEALAFNSTGTGNTSTGYGTLSSNGTGNYNTATGFNALYGNSSGSYNTAIGYAASPRSLNLSNSTAIGANANVSSSNSLVLGQTTMGNPGASYVNVGIGTDTPRSILEASATIRGALGPVITLTNGGGAEGAASAVDFNSYAPSTSGTYTPAARIEALDDDFADDIYFLANQQGAPNQGLVTNMIVDANGNVAIRGTISAAAKEFKIDDPLDPANKYLNHTSVESSEMMNIYTGNIVTNELGIATVTLPAWFEAENTDYRYQLTVVGGRFAQAIVSQEIANSEFTISTNATNVKVSWQVTAVRQDAYAKAHPMIVEQQKSGKEQGTYLHPELFDQQQAARQLKHDQPASAVNRSFSPAAASWNVQHSQVSQRRPIQQAKN